ncbi:MAG: TauD/TfdA family dioxygenase [Thiothrix sp.]
MTNTATQRPIYPFGDQPFALGMEDYQVDCATHADDLEQAIRGQWREQGLVVLKNTGMQHLSELQRWAEVLFQDFAAYEGGSAPRDKFGKHVFALGDAPPTIDLCFHNEGCYLPVYPRCFVIGSTQCPQEGGFTLLADNEKATQALLATDIGQKLRDKGMRYVRMMYDRELACELGYKPWQDTFFTNDPREAEQSVQAKGWDYEWLPNGHLRTSYSVDAYEYHPELDKSLFFAGLASHAAFFDQWHPFNTMPDEERPLNMTLGDGTPFTNQEIVDIYAAYNHASLALDWKQADLALLDNLRWAHARPAFTLQAGEERVLGVTMGMMTERVGNRF